MKKPYVLIRIENLVAVFVGAGIVLASPIAVFATPFVIPSSPISQPADAIDVVCQVGAWLFYILIAVSIVMAIFAAYKYLTSGGDESKVSEAHKTLTYAAVGVAVALISWGLPNLVSWLLADKAFGTAC